jgi:hypothetical protein
MPVSVCKSIRSTDMLASQRGLSPAYSAPKMLRKKRPIFEKKPGFCAGFGIAEFAAAPVAGAIAAGCGVRSALL